MTEEQIENIYIIGACCWLLSDMVSDNENVKLLRGLKEALPELAHVSGVSLSAVKATAEAERYCKRLINGNYGVIEHADKEATAQFSYSADYLYNWLRVLLRTPDEKIPALNDDINALVAVVLGKTKPLPSPIDRALEWIELYPSSGGISVQSVKNKLIQLKNAPAVKTP